MIKIIGLGVTDGDLSIRGAVAIDSADTIIVKTALTETYNFFSEYETLTCDDIYNSAENFDDLDTRLVNFVMKYKNKNTVYCVNGNGYDDNSAQLLKKLDSSIVIIPSVGRDSMALDNSPRSSYISLSAYDVAKNATFDYDHALELIIKDIDNEFVASEIKTTLARVIGEESMVTLFIGGEVKDIPVYDLDREHGYDYATLLLVKPQEFLTQNVYNYLDLMRIMYILRGENGCSWDKAQTHASIRPNVIEEAYELVEAINNDDIDNIIEESGDIILQGAFHTVIGVEEGEFEQQEVLTHLCKKLISRHTHIFGADKATTPEEALKAWERAKAKEKSTPTGSSKMLSVARALPSLLRAEKVQKTARKSGLDFANIEDIKAKVREEYAEYLSATDKEDEGGDLLFTIVNLLRYEGINSEVALNRSIEKFINRFAYIENACEKQAVEMSALSAEELDALWNEAKSDENR